MTPLAFATEAEEQRCCMPAVLCSGHDIHWAEHGHPAVPVFHG